MVATHPTGLGLLLVTTIAISGALAAYQINSAVKEAREARRRARAAYLQQAQRLQQKFESEEQLSAAARAEAASYLPKLAAVASAVGLILVLTPPK